jgi:hypothetical protein
MSQQSNSTQDDPILGAKTIADLMQALNQVYGLSMPTTFPPQSQTLLEMWQSIIEVLQGPSPTLYTSKTKVPFPFSSLAALAGTIVIKVVQQT